MMIEEVSKPDNHDELDVETDNKKSKRVHKAAHCRSLSGSSIPSKACRRRNRCDLKFNKEVKLENSKVEKSNGNPLSTMSSMETSIDSLSSSSGNNVTDLYHSLKSRGKCDIFKSRHTQQCQSVSAKTKIKHFLSEHLVLTHHCHHPEYHCHRKHGDNCISSSDSKNDDLHESGANKHCDENLSSNSLSNQRPRSDQELNLVKKPLNIASHILERIRLINIQSNDITIQSDIISTRERTMNDESTNESTIDPVNSFPFPEPDPDNLPWVLSPSSIDFSTKHILSDKSKHHKLSHSMSYDQHYKLADFCKHKRHLNTAMSLGPEFIPEKDKWEKKISGYVDTSTSTGATLTAINFGLKRVTETDKYLMITKSPTSCPNDFLEDGICHVEDSNEIYQSLMRHSTCYDVMPDSGKVIIIDSQMEIGRAFNAIEEHIVRASPIWSSEKQSFIALLNVTDLVPLLLHLQHQSNTRDLCCEDEACDDLETATVERCLSIIPRFRAMQNHMVQVTPETNLRAVNTLFNQFHKSTLLVIDSFLSGNPLFLLTGLRILSYLFYRVNSITIGSCFLADILSSGILLDQRFEVVQPLSEDESPCDSLRCSTPQKRHYLVFPSSSIIDVLRAMAMSYGCCALVVEDDCPEKKYIINNVITMADILNLIKIQKHKDPTLTTEDLLQYQKQYAGSMTYRDPVISCCVQESMFHLIHEIVKRKASYVLIRSGNDPQSETMGIVTVHDILTYIDSLPYNPTDAHDSVLGITRASKLENPKRLHHKNQEIQLKFQIDTYSQNRCIPIILDDCPEENIDGKTL